jgi:2-iminobutanoate/2-iminopropanoate deaminase
MVLTVTGGSGRAFRIAHLTLIWQETPRWRGDHEAGFAKGAPTMAIAEYFPVAGSLAGMNLPFSEAVRVGDVLYLSGALGLDETGTLVGGGIAAETRQALANIREVLERHGSSLDRVVKATAMLADMGEWAAMNVVYVEHFPTNLPARSAFATSGLALGARIELEVIAMVD